MFNAVLAGDYLADAIETGLVYSDEINAYIMPLFTDKTLPPNTRPSDILAHITCSECSEQLCILQYSIDEFYLSYYDTNTVGEFEQILGICTECNAVINVRETVKYLL